MKSTLILIPAHNEEASIGALLKGLQDEGVHDFADILVVDDYSDDQTGNIVRMNGELALRNIFNLGYGSAIQLGYKYAVRRGYQYVIQMDADGQHDICNVFALYEALHSPDPLTGKPQDIVIGSRFLPGSVSFPCSGLKMLAIRLFRFLIRWLSGKRLTDPTSGLQGLRRPAFLFYSMYNNFNARYPDANMIIQMILLGFNVTEIPAVMHAREAGVSMHKGFFKPIVYMLLMMVSIVTVSWREKHRPDKVPVVDERRGDATC